MNSQPMMALDLFDNELLTGNLTYPLTCCQAAFLLCVDFIRLKALTSRADDLMPAAVLSCVFYFIALMVAPSTLTSVPNK